MGKLIRWKHIKPRGIFRWGFVDIYSAWVKATPNSITYRPILL
jgi:hypothetical protein